MSRSIPIFTVAFLLSGSGVASAQMAQAIADGIANSGGPPTLATITPPGATVGKTTEWTVSGTNLGEVQEWRVTGRGVTVIAATADKVSARLKVKVDADAPPGYREVRALGPKGISNLGLVHIDPLDLVQELRDIDVHATAWNDARAASSVSSMSASVWANEVKPLSKAEGAR